MHAGNCVCQRCDLGISANWPRGGQFSASATNFGNQRREKVPTAVRYFFLVSPRHFSPLSQFLDFHDARDPSDNSFPGCVGLFPRVLLVYKISLSCDLRAENIC
jgi:hypothetical protein